MAVSSGGIPTAMIGDLIDHTLPQFHKRGRFETAFELNDYHVINEWFTEDKIVYDSGNQVEWRLIFEGNGSARHSRLFQARDHNYVNLLTKGFAPWVFADAEAYYESHIVTMARDESALVDYIETQYFAAYRDLADEIEPKSFSTPESASDDINPMGVPMWINMLDAGQVDYTGGFNGKTAIYGDGTTTTNVGGVNKAAQALARNWAANHRGMGAQLLETLRRGFIHTKCRPPRTVREFYDPGRNMHRIYSNQEFAVQYEGMANAGPDPKMGDLNPFKGEALTFRGVEWIGLQILDDAAYDPVYVLNMRHFFPVVHDGWWMREDETMRDVDLRHLWITGIDCQYQYACDNMKYGGFVVHEPIPAA